MASADSVPRLVSRRSNSSIDLGTDEDRNGVGIALADGQSALNVNLQDYPLSRLEARGNLAPQRAIPITPAKNLEALDEFTRFPTARRTPPGQKVIVDAVLLAGPRRPGGRRHAGNQPGAASKQAFHQRRFPGPRRAGNHDNAARLAGQLRQGCDSWGWRKCRSRAPMMLSVIRCFESFPASARWRP